MLNKKVDRQSVLDALTYIDKNGVPKNRNSTKYNLHQDNKIYSPKYVLSIATKIATGKELEPTEFNGGNETNSFLMSLGFTIKEGNKQLQKMSSKSSIKICCAIIQTSISSDEWDDTRNNSKIKLLEFIIARLNKTTDILILPAGFLNTSNKKPQTIFDNIEKTVVELIVKHCPHLNICLGIDGRYKNDQLLLTISKKGIVAIARKFHHMDNNIELADNPFTIEQSKPRHFELKKKKAYLAVCYDIFGIAQTKPENKNNYNFIIGAIHGFGKSGGDSDFARKGLAGASKQWRVNSYASAVFSDNRNPINWTSGVEWKHGDESVKNFKYDDIRIKSKRQIINADIGTIYLDYYEE